MKENEIIMIDVPEIKWIRKKEKVAGTSFGKSDVENITNPTHVFRPNISRTVYWMDGATTLPTLSFFFS